MTKEDAGAIKAIKIIIAMFLVVIIGTLCLVGIGDGKDTDGTITTQQYLGSLEEYILRGTTKDKDIDKAIVRNSIDALILNSNKEYKDFKVKRADRLYKLYKESNDSITRVVILEYLLGLDEGPQLINKEEKEYIDEVSERIAKELSEEPEKILKYTIELDGIDSEYEGFKKELLKRAISGNTELVRGTKDENLKYLDVLGVDY